jgi:hypothetical protein
MIPYMLFICFSVFSPFFLPSTFAAVAVVNPCRVIQTLVGTTEPDRSDGVESRVPRDPLFAAVKNPYFPQLALKALTDEARVYSASPVFFPHLNQQTFLVIDLGRIPSIHSPRPEV